MPAYEFVKYAQLFRLKMAYRSRLIGTLLSSGLKEQEKLDIIEHEYNIPISTELREDVRNMCNLSTGIEERATENLF